MEQRGRSLAGGVSGVDLGAPIGLECASVCCLCSGPIILAMAQILQVHFVSVADLVFGPGALKSLYGGVGGRCLLEFSLS